MYLFLCLVVIALLGLFLGRISRAGQPRRIEDALPGSILIHYRHANVQYRECASADTGCMSLDDFADGYFLNPEVFMVEVKDKHGDVSTFLRREE